MNRDLNVRPLGNDWTRLTHDLFITSIGYERRARFVAEELAPAANHRSACGFQNQQLLEYNTNTEWMEKHGFDVSHESEAHYGAWLLKQLKRLPNNREPARVLIDISSMTRVRIASALLVLKNLVEREIIADFVYSLASFSSPQESMFPNSHVGPVRAEFAGWWEEPDRAVVAVVGLGYEEDKALGAVEHLQAGEVWTFIPQSPIVEYTAALQAANRTLLESVESEHQLPYRVQDPFECFARLESLVFGLSQDKNVVLLPFGPKIFSLSALVVGLLHQSVPVWRVSAEGHEPAVNRGASGEVYGLEVHFATA